MSSQISSQNQPDTRYLLVLMGASNLSRGYSALVSSLKKSLRPHPVEVLQAMGPGRGYYAQGGLLNISYSPISTCGILEAAKERQSHDTNTLAFLTDVGNDIMYNVSPDKIISCLHSIIQELDDMGAELFVHPIPMVLEEDVPEWQFKILRKIFFSTSPVTFLEAANAVQQINGFLQNIKGGRVHILPSAKEYCGLDKIHYSMLHSHKAWCDVVDAICHTLPAMKTPGVTRLSAWQALFANMGRLFFCDMVPIRKQIPGTF